MPNVVIDGVTYATDSIGGVNYQYVKLTAGQAGNAQPISGSTANGVEVDVTRVKTTVVVSGPATNAELRATPLPVSGSLAVTGPLTNAELRLSAIPISGAVTGPITDAQLRATPPEFRARHATTAVVTSVASQTVSTLLIASNPNRLGLQIDNESTSKCRIKYGTGPVSLSSYTARIWPDTQWEMPYPYTGDIYIIWESANGNARVTEVS